jgi:hypothetical protein
MLWKKLEMYMLVLLIWWIQMLLLWSRNSNLIRHLLSFLIKILGFFLIIFYLVWLRRMVLLIRLIKKINSWCSNMLWSSIRNCKRDIKRRKEKVLMRLLQLLFVWQRGIHSRLMLAVMLKWIKNWLIKIKKALCIIVLLRIEVKSMI